MTHTLATSPSKVIDAVYHERLLGNLDHYCRMAGVRRDFVFQSASNYLTPPQLAWLKDFSKTPDSGLLMVQDKHQSVPLPDAMMAMAAACLRNYLDARVVTLQQCFDSLMDDSEVARPRLLLISNFCTTSTVLSEWQQQAISDLLTVRYMHQKKTVVGAINVKAISNRFGAGVEEHLTTHFARF